MPRYTDIDKLIAEYDRVHVGPAGGARKLMVEAPIADVAPRAEVAREIFEEIESEIVAALQSNYRLKQECVEKQLPDNFVSYMREGKIAALRGIEAFVEELKKKYTNEVQK